MLHDCSKKTQEFNAGWFAFDSNFRELCIILIVLQTAEGALRPAGESHSGGIIP